jgi:hypothetical protein
MKGGNSNWRGPIWLPLNYMILSSLKKYAEVYGERFKIHLSNEKEVGLQEVVHSFAQRLLSLFTQDASHKRPFHGALFPFSQDPHFKDHILFYEYFHAETGQGLGASHQTGWSALIANIIDEFLSPAP